MFDSLSPPKIDYSRCPMFWWLVEIRRCVEDVNGPCHKTFVRAADYESAKSRAVAIGRDLRRFRCFDVILSPMMERGLVRRQAFAGYGDE